MFLGWVFHPHSGCQIPTVGGTSPGWVTCPKVSGMSLE